MTTMPLMRLPNAEMLLSQFYRADPDVLAIQGDDTYTELPSRFTGWPATKITRVGGAPPFTDPLVIDRPLMQVEVYGGPKSLAADVAETQRAALVAVGRLPFVALGVGELSTVVRFGTLRYVPDPTWDPARPRYIYDLVLQTRALPGPPTA
jgi:hypothetical protein